MSLITAYDAVTASSLPANATHVFYYADGAFANEAAVKAQCPHAVTCGITVIGQVGPGACDCEAGDLTVAQAETWVTYSLKAGVYRPRVYANQDRWENQGLLAGLAHYGPNIRRWVAAYPGAGATVPPGYDAHQYEGGTVNPFDLNVCLPDFFATKPPAPPVDPPHGTAHALVSLNLADGAWSIHHIPGTAHYGGRDEWWSAEVQINRKTGKWRVHPLPINAKPLGG
jgi:hypothetical protein